MCENFPYVSVWVCFVNIGNGLTVDRRFVNPLVARRDKRFHKVLRLCVPEL